MTFPEITSHDDTSGPLVNIGFKQITRERWAAHGRRDDTALLTRDVSQLVATGEPVAFDEMVDIYVPLAQFIILLATTKSEMHERTATFLAEDCSEAPFIIGIAGSVAVGKSTAARVLQTLLRGIPGHPSVDLLTTDGFLYPNTVLEARGLMERKGFPESYDQRRLIGTLAAIRAGDADVAAPIYSHLAYDVVPGQFQVFHRPAVVIVEGLNVLQVNTEGASREHVAVSDFFDFSIYVDAAEHDIARWFVKRLLTLRATALRQPDSFLHQFASLTEEEVSTIAWRIWTDVNLVNLRENVAPTRSRAHLILEKDAEHSVRQLLLRRS